MGIYYEANKILSLKTLSGGVPDEIYVVGNKSAGKTTNFEKLMFRWSIQGHCPWNPANGCFNWLVRKKKSVKGTEENWRDALQRWYPGRKIKLVGYKDWSAAFVYLDGKKVGNIISFNDTEFVKTSSLVFSDAAYNIFDEFQIESGQGYLTNEVVKYNSARVALSKGGMANQAAVKKPTILLANNVSKYNPYFVERGIDKVIRPNTKFARGDIWVLEQTWNAEAARLVAENVGGMSQKELEYTTQNKYLLDSDKFVDTPAGDKTLLVWIRYRGKDYSVWGTNEGLLYVTNNLDGPRDQMVVVDESDHDIGTLLLPRNHGMFKTFKNFYEGGNVRFKNEPCRRAFLLAIGVIKETASN